MLIVNQNTNDLVFENGVLQELPDANEETGQQIRSRLMTVQGEWFLDTEFGLDYRGVVWIKQTPSQVRDAHIQNQILLSAGAGAEIRTYEATFDGATRTLSVTADVKLGSGEIITVSL